MKTIRYPHMWRYRWFHWYQVCIVLKFVYVSSKHPRVFLESLRQFSAILGHLQTLTEIVGTCSGTFVWPSEQFWKIFGNHQESGLKSSENHQKRHHQYVHVIKRTLQVSSKIWILSSRGKNNISLVRYAHCGYCSCHSNQYLLATV